MALGAVCRQDGTGNHDYTVISYEMTVEHLPDGTGFLAEDGSLFIAGKSLSVTTDLRKEFNNEAIPLGDSIRWILIGDVLSSSTLAELTTPTLSVRAAP